MIANGLTAWLLLRSATSITLQGGSNNYPSDLAATAFLLLSIIALIIIPIFRKNVRTGKLKSIELDRRNLLHLLLSCFPVNPALSALTFGLLGLVVVTPLTVTVMYLLDFTHITPLSYAIFKGIWAGVLAGVTARPMVLLGLANSKVHEVSNRI